MKYRKKVDKISESKSKFFKEINKIKTSLARLTRKKTEDTITNMRDEREDITPNFT